MFTKIRTRAAGESGFTLVELLVVMLILGLLAAIAIPSFYNQRMKAQDAEAKATARSTQTAMETYATQNKGSYSGATIALLQGIEPTIPSSGVTVTPNAGTPSRGYTIVSTSKSLSTFTIARSDAGAITFPCTTGGIAGCPERGAADFWD